MNVGYFINRIWTPLEKINWSTLKADGISEVYIRCAEENLEAITAYLPAIKAAGLVPYAWTWEGYSRYTETVAKGWNIVADIEGYDMPSHVQEIKNIQSICKSYQKTFILCTKAQDWDGDQIYSTLVPLCDYLMPMLYIGDYNKTVLQLGNWMLQYNAKYPRKIYPALETYISDANPTPKTNTAITSELTMVEPYCDGAALFRYGLSNYKGEVSMTQLTSGNVTLAVFNDMRTRYNNYVAANNALPNIIYTVSGGQDYVTLQYFDVMVQNKDSYVRAYGTEPNTVEITLKVKTFGNTTPSTVGPIQKQIQDGTGHTWTNFTGFYQIILDHCVYAYYFNGQYSKSGEVNELIADINGAAAGLNCVDYTQIGMALAQEMGYTTVAYGIWCEQDQINHAIFTIQGKEFTNATWIDLAAAANSNYKIGTHWCSGKLTKNPSWIPLE